MVKGEKEGVTCEVSNFIEKKKRKREGTKLEGENHPSQKNK